MEQSQNQFTYPVYNGGGVLIGEATVLASGALHLNIPPTPAARVITTRLVMDETNKLILIERMAK